MSTEECNEVIGSIAIFIVLRNEGNLTRAVEAVGVFLKGGTDETDCSFHVLHQRTDKLGGTISRDDILLADAIALTGKQAVDLHSGRILRKECLKLRLHLVNKFLGREIGIDEIAEVEHLRETPIPAETAIELGADLLIGKDGLSDVEVLLVVDLVPLLIVEEVPSVSGR